MAFYRIEFENKKHFSDGIFRDLPTKEWEKCKKIENELKIPTVFLPENINSYYILNCVCMFSSKGIVNFKEEIKSACEFYLNKGEPLILVKIPKINKKAFIYQDEMQIVIEEKLLNGSKVIQIKTVEDLNNIIYLK